MPPSNVLFSGSHFLFFLKSCLKFLWFVLFPFFAGNVLLVIFPVGAISAKTLDNVRCLQQTRRYDVNEPDLKSQMRII